MVSKLTRSVVCLVVILGMVVTTAGAANKDRIGTAGAQELLIPVGARGLALGASSMVFAQGVDALYWNPAGLGRIDRSVEAMVSQMSYIADISVTYGAIGVNAGELGALGFSLKSLSFGNIPVTTENFPDGTGEQYSPSFLNLGVTYSKLLTDRISVGLTATLVSEKIMSTSATGVALNVGIQYRNLGIQGLDLGIAIRNFGPNMTYDGTNLLRLATPQEGIRGTTYYKVQAASFELPSSMEIGVGYSRKLDDQNTVLIGAMFRNNNYQDDEYSLGGEYSFNNMFFVRGGYQFSPQTDKDPTGSSSYIYDYTLGAGVQYEVGGLNLEFDYAYRHVRYFDGNNAVTLRVGF